MTNNDLQSALAVLQSGGLILYPTDTIWGIGCDATLSPAVQRIIGVKERADHKSFVILVSDLDMLEQYVEEVPPMAYSLIEVSDKPLTLVYPQARNLAPEVVGADGTVAIRVVNHPFCQELIRRFGKPIVSTSANRAGAPSPKCFEDIEPELRAQLEHCVDPKWEAPATGQPSSIIKISLNGAVQIIRN